MIKIYKDRDIKVVTNGAYEQIYKPLGYNIVIENIEPETVKEQNTFTRYNEEPTRTRRVSSTKKNKKED